MKQVLIIDHSSLLGGAEYSLESLVKGMDSNCYKYTIALPETGPFADSLENNGIQVDFLKLESWRWWVRTPRQALKYFLALPLQLISIIRWLYYLNSIKPDIVHFNINRLIEPVIAARILGMVSVMHFRDIPSRIDSRFILGMPVFYKIMNLAGAWISNSNSVKDDISPFGKVPIQTIYNGLDINDFDLRSDQKCEIELPKDNITIAMMGGINPWKQQKEFIKIAINVLKKRKNILFYVVGGIVVQSYYLQLMKIVNDSDNSMNIIFTGNIKNTAAMLKKIDIMLHTAVESFGRVFIEAMAAKKPVVAFNSGGASEIVVNDETGILVPNGEIDVMEKAVLSLIDDPDKGKNMGETGRKRVEENYSIAMHCEDVANVYQYLLNGNLMTT